MMMMMMIIIIIITKLEPNLWIKKKKKLSINHNNLCMIMHVSNKPSSSMDGQRTSVYVHVHLCV